MHLGAGGAGEIFIGTAAGGGGGTQQFSRWRVDEVQGRRRGEFIAALQGATVNKRPNYIDLLLLLKAR